MDAARDAACRLLIEILDRQVTLEVAQARVAAFAGLDGRDRSFAAALTLTTLRWLGLIEAVSARFMTKPLPSTAGYARAVLASGAAQILSGLAPSHAAVSRAVALAKAERGSVRFSGVINAVLRRIGELDPASLDPADALHPVWRARWLTAYGPEAVRALARVALQTPPLDLSLRGAMPEGLTELGGTLLPGGSVRLPAAPSDVTALPGWAEGALWVQDAAAALPARLLGAGAGERVLDLCAAPGGKTLQLAAIGARVTSVDVDAARLARVQANLDRTGLEADLIAGDGRTLEGQWDHVLLDAPCSATGTVRRHPEALWTKNPTTLSRLMALQADLTAAAARLLRPGGRLVYAVCSLEPEEALAGTRAALAAGLMADPVQPGELPGLEAAIAADGTVRILPGLWEDRGGLDGFFIARFRKPAG